MQVAPVMLAGSFTMEIQSAEDALPEDFEVANADNPCFDLLTKKLGKRLQL